MCREEAGSFLAFIHHSFNLTNRRQDPLQGLQRGVPACERGNGSGFPGGPGTATSATCIARVGLWVNHGVIVWSLFYGLAGVSKLSA